MKNIALATLIAGILFSLKNNDKERIDTSITLIDLNKNSHKIEEWKGKWVIVNFWATWCEPCREEIPSFIELQSKFKDKNL